MKHTSTRHAILQAARRVVRAGGAATLTLDAVAHEAGVSKGGLLYHFPSKDKLIAGMLEQMLASFDDDVRAAAEAPGQPPGAWARAYASITCAPEWQSHDLSADLLAAVSTNADLLEPVRARYAEWQRLLEYDGIDPAIATLVRLAADGLWFADMFGLAPPSGPLRAQVLEALIALTQE
ncbi:MAG TPA: TetR/AcrR family transcriptional regulator [Kouleothrix sp.]|uniref:TetR/AcrR family transcriptional regulator n=1 Tax=Kouleothrix sp. TaxID=2779161 RepID=UPI002C705290|nr:TetR/AcrR family transcriptional regulator [Kouleothrix sp.]HRC76298.1 TetR/AcrR family transcriptional regulator [Kouleothrix sp.]